MNVSVAIPSYKLSELVERKSGVHLNIRHRNSGKVANGLQYCIFG